MNFASLAMPVGVGIDNPSRSRGTTVFVLLRMREAGGWAKPRIEGNLAAGFAQFFNLWAGSRNGII